MKTFVLGDIHGAAKALDQCLSQSGFDFNQDVLIQLGDVTDCYPDVYECVETLLTVINLIAIKGNHDDWFCEFISTDFHPQYWNHGVLGTLTSYLDHAGKARQYKETGRGYKTALISSDVPVTHQNFFMRQQLHHVDEHSRCFVHGGFKPEVPFYLQRPEEFIGIVRCGTTPTNTNYLLNPVMILIRLATCPNFGKSTWVTPQPPIMAVNSR